MKTLIKCFCITALMALGVSSSFASVDMFLKIEDVKGESKVVKLRCDDGACRASIDDMKAGKYTFTLCDSKGTPLKMKAKEKANHAKSMSMNFTKITFEYTVKAPRDVATGQSSGKRDVATGQSTGKRDAATGQATGKRQHGEVKITKEVSPGGVFVATGDLDGDGALDLKIKWTSSDGGTSAMDDWESPVN